MRGRHSEHRSAGFGQIFERAQEVVAHHEPHDRRTDILTAAPRMDARHVRAAGGDQSLLDHEIIVRPFGSRLVTVSRHLDDGVGDLRAEGLGHDAALDDHDG